MATKQSSGGLKWLVIVSAIIVVAAAGVWYFKRGNNDAPQYQTTTVVRGDLMQAVTATGTLNPVLNVQVGCQVSGRISILYADFNSPVTNGQLIAELDPRTYVAQAAQASADLANARANLELQTAQAKRSADLFTNTLISGSDYDTAIATRDEAQAMVQIKEASLTNALANLGYCKI
jgi:HlyD family secretion protein